MKRVPGEQNIADALSRLIQEAEKTIPFEEEDDNHFLFSLDAGFMDITWEEIERHSENDEELELVRGAITCRHWPVGLRRFEVQKDNLHVLGSLFFKDDKSILPYQLRLKAMQLSHSGHVGETAMKSIMREFFWWPGMASDVVKYVKQCETCTTLSRKSPPVPLSSRELPDGPWQIIQIEFLSMPTFGSGLFLVPVDSYSRYLSIIQSN
ncbi:uncharacterized protein K02A2.6-like [Topomyia yanbarensis]|uniref:uncharacterized protein K02A2.6-like n=1 Tax=Topomyia yanbarensis TaxID=2498891 RepID=UPI00273BA407|nr:uncharacterized protein K02A2.6-like [Topomyia yanbarensis]